jgi:hypothetical protein
MSDNGHRIRVPAKFARHARHYIEGYMRAYVRTTDALAARRRKLGAAPSPKKASDEDFKPKETRVQQRLRKGV